MGFNYGLERKKFETEFAKFRALATKYGMPEAQINEMYRYGLDELNSNRAYAIHTQSLDDYTFEDGDNMEEGQNPLYYRFMESLSIPAETKASSWSRYGWVEDLDTPAFVIAIRGLSFEDLEILTMLVMDQLSKAEIARERNVSRAAITKRCNKIKQILQEVRN